jgi:hypothetical protein
MDSWKTQGMDIDSVVANPRIAGAASGDWRLQAGSPALKLGFAQLNISTVGPRPRSKSDDGLHLPQPTWAPAQCTLGKSAAAAVWFADIGEKILERDTAPALSCGAALQLSGARGEHITVQAAQGRLSALSVSYENPFCMGLLYGRPGCLTAENGGFRPGQFQIAVRSTTALNGVVVNLTSDLGRRRSGPDIQREVYTLVTTAANNVTSRGVGRYPDPLPFPNDTVRFPQGGDMVQAGETAVFWVTLGPIPATTTAGLHTARLSVGGTTVQHCPVEVHVWDFTLPEAADASQWTEAGPFSAMSTCNTLEMIRPESCYPAGSFWPAGPHNHSHNLSLPKPCLQTSVVDATYQNMYDHRINRNVWAFFADGVAAGVGLTIANDTQTMEVDMAAFDRNFAKLVELGYRDLKLPIPGAWHGGSYQVGFGSPNVTFTFVVNSSVASFDSKTGRGWWGSCEPPDARGQPDSGGNRFPESKGLPCLQHQPLSVPVWQNASLNAPSKSNASVPTWMNQDVGDPIEFNPEFLRLFSLLMKPVVANLRAKGWINRTFAWVADEAPWPCYNHGINFTVCVLICTSTTVICTKFSTY